jgi:hypothetical protein
VFSGGQPAWRDYVLLTTESITGTNTYLNGTKSEVYNLAAAQILTSGGADVEGEFAAKYKITAIRLYIDAGSATYFPGTATGQAATLSTNAARLVTVQGIEFNPAVKGVRVGKGWYLTATNDYMTLQPSTIEMGGIGKVTVKSKGGWEWFGMPVTDFERQYNFITIKFSGPTPLLHLGVMLVAGSASMVVNGSAAVFDYENTELGEYPFTRTISYDRAADTYTLTIDLRGSDLDNDRFIITTIAFYLNDPDANTPPLAEPFEIEFKGVTFTRPE